jgi:Disulphide bond corrector protein DsbC
MTIGQMTINQMTIDQMTIDQKKSRNRERRNSRRLCVLVTLILLATANLSFAQTPGKAPTLEVAAVPLVTAQRGQATMVNLNFRVPPGYHINSNTPKSEFLIPTGLKMDLPTDIILGKIEYPAGEDRNFPFSPDEKLSVYSGDFTIAVAVHPLHSVVPGKYVMRGVLRYQACDNAACYPPKNLPVNFEVKVVKEPASHHANPAQSPHVN